MKTILIVDDSRTTRNYHAAIASGGGFQVITAVDGADGLDKLMSHACDLVLADINMQGMDGYEFITRLRANPEFADLPVVIVSTEGRDKDKAKGFAAGANLYVVKPSSPETLLANIQMLLAKEAP